MHDSDKIKALQFQAQGSATCPYATNLVADEIKREIDQYRGDGSQLKYVVIAGGDDVIPFFRYADTSGIGQESQYSPPMKPASASGAEPEPGPVPQPGRLRLLDRRHHRRRRHPGAGAGRRPAGEDTAGDRGVDRPLPVARRQTLPVQPTTTTTPDGTSLVTGYDFLADAAHRVKGEFQKAFPTATTTTSSRSPASPHDQSWTAET